MKRRAQPPVKGGNLTKNKKYPLIHGHLTYLLSPCCAICEFFRHYCCRTSHSTSTLLRGRVEAFFKSHLHAHHLFHAPTFLESLSYPPAHARFPSLALLHALCAVGCQYTTPMLILPYIPTYSPLIGWKVRPRSNISLLTMPLSRDLQRVSGTATQRVWLVSGSARQTTIRRKAR